MDLTTKIAITDAAIRAFQTRNAAAAKAKAATTELAIAEREYAEAVERLEAVNLKEGV